MMQARILFSITLIASLHTIPCIADDGATVAVGGTIKLLEEHHSVRMVAEHVRIKLEDGDFKVVCVFILQNTGPATTVTIGFPNESGGAGVDSVHPFTTFDSYVDGEPVPIEILPDANNGKAFSYRSWYVKRVTFEPRQVRCIWDTYTGTNGGGSAGFLFFQYVLWSGGSWAGPIGTADVIVEWDPQEAPLDSVNIRPNGYVVSGNEIRWHLTDIEPRARSYYGEIGLSWRSRDWKPRHPDR